MGFLKKLWKKLKPVRKTAKEIAEDYARRKIEKELRKRRER